MLATCAAQGLEEQSMDGAQGLGEEILPFAGADLVHALLCLVVAATLGALLAFRPRRSGEPAQVSHLIQTQVMLAVLGALVMLIVGASVARAFGIAAVASLVRYQSNIGDTKDASVMLSCLAIGLASGVGQLYLATAGTAFIVGVLWMLEWRAPWAPKGFQLKITAQDPSALKSEVERLLVSHRITFELRGSTETDLTYSTDVPHGQRTDRLSGEIVALHGPQAVAVAWEEKQALKGPGRRAR
jgi:Domain of unknown function (DUF4956)